MGWLLCCGCCVRDVQGFSPVRFLDGMSVSEPGAARSPKARRPVYVVDVVVAVLRYTFNTHRHRIENNRHAYAPRSVSCVLTLRLRVVHGCADVRRYYNPSPRKIIEPRPR